MGEERKDGGQGGLWKFWALPFAALGSIRNSRCVAFFFALMEAFGVRTCVASGGFLG